MKHILEKIKGFTLVELLATIAILAIILTITIPATFNIISNSKDKTFIEQAKIVVNAIEAKKADYPSFDPTTITVTNIDDLIGINPKNFESIVVSVSGNDIYVTIVGKNTWESLTVSGTIDNFVITK